MKRPRKPQRSYQPVVAETSHRRTPTSSRAAVRSKATGSFRMFFIPCSCGTTFAVAEHYDRQGTGWSRYMICPGCGKRHDPKNRLLQLGFHPEGYWKVDEC